MARRGPLIGALGVLMLILSLFVSACNAGDEEEEQGADATQETADPGPDGVEGPFSLIMMVHTADSPGDFGVEDSVPWDGELVEETRFAYRSIGCDGDAPVNNISSDLPSYNTRVAESRTPSSMRAHPLEFQLVQDGEEWRMEGNITFTVCRLGPGPTPEEDPIPDEQKPKIEVSFEAGFERATQESVPWSGTFEVTGGTGRYENLSGSGEIAGYWFCFAPEGCAETTGNFRDGQLVMNGTFSDSDPRLDEPGLLVEQQR